jgi:hypothetical protein
MYLPLLHFTQNTALLKIAMRAALSLPAGPGRKSPAWWWPNWRSPRKLLDFREFVGLQTYIPRNHFYYISITMNGTKFIK